jgi:hypothetical protein
VEAIVVVVVWILLSVLAGRIAEKKGRRAGSYFLISLLLTPVVGLLLAAVATPDRASAEKVRIASGDERKCPFCAEMVKREAKLCRYCGKELPPPEPVSGVPRFKTRAEFDAWKAKTDQNPPLIR